MEQDGVQNLFGRVFGSQSLPETYGGDSVTDSNLMTFLAMIEEKTNELLQVSGPIRLSISRWLNR